MSKALIVFDIPDNCNAVTAEVVCFTDDGEGHSLAHLHELVYDGVDVRLRAYAYKQVEEQLKELGIH